MMKKHQTHHRAWIIAGLGASLVIAVLLSPFASQHPDGLDRVAGDLQFDQKAHPEPMAQKFPFYALFDEYALRGVSEPLGTPLAGLIGTLVTFSLAWGMGKIVVRNSPQPEENLQ
jgi:cobalt/nickel transport protein